MMTRFLCASLFVSASFLVGCDEQKPATPPAAPEKSQSQGVGGAAIDQAQKTVGGVKTDAAKTVDAAKTQTDAAAKAAEGQVQQVMDYIKENKLDLAEQALAKLEAAKASLPAAIQDKLATARQALNTAKAAAGKLQNLPGLPK